MADRTRAKNRIQSFLLQHGIPEPEGLKHWSRAGVEELRQVPLCAELRFCLDSLLVDLEHACARVVLLDRRLAVRARSERHARTSPNVAFGR